MLDNRWKGLKMRETVIFLLGTESSSVWQRGLGLVMREEAGETGKSNLRGVLSVRVRILISPGRLVEKIKNDSAFVVKNGLQRWQSLKQSTAIYMSVLPALLGYKDSETGQTSVFVSLPSPGVSLWKYFNWVHETRYITSVPSSLLITATTLLQEKIKLSWSGWHALHKILFVPKWLSFSKPLLIIHLMMHPSIFLRMIVLLAGISVRIHYQKTLFCFGCLSVKYGWWFYWYNRVIVRVKLVNVSK